MNLQAIVNALFEAGEEFKACKRNASGSINGNSKQAVKKRLVAKLMEAGENRSDAWAMAHDLGRNYN
ncbi:hypothetical protein PAK_P30107 [Pseudomonas phage PAK_P3]|nr:hypothetical protein PAK_P30107 [Pseudomonas phage PAK_P3]YP_009206111.1 hypothetical protein AVT15_gp055 [Pseudomonas phage vB_PaeM_PS24]YP_010761774.1 hypothetical protein QE320_gp067 [Pseudomonas phage EM]AGS81716.1 hypothetical protein P3_CHA0108 [Pseudomonas phage P3_CHA]AGS81835.1 hypothetical protein PAK_P30107 [Pseudomonas phage PAK_P3]AIW01851.1 hypothetical protein vB_PaeM_PS2400149 [Pseudomonas phage vB_PaeM_PS24]UPW35987.1 hypothetical protein EM_202 [Pseudomonas phage EM]